MSHPFSGGGVKRVQAVGPGHHMDHRVGCRGWRAFFHAHDDLLAVDAAIDQALSAQQLHGLDGDGPALAAHIQVLGADAQDGAGRVVIALLAPEPDGVETSRCNPYGLQWYPGAGSSPGGGGLKFVPQATRARCAHPG